MKKYIIALILLWFSSVVFADSSSDFISFYAQSGWGLGWWSVAIAAGVAVVVGTIIFFTGGTASPIVVWVGSTIGGFSGLTGAAATNYGLALLGGGAIANGGLGIAGGTALLTAVFTFSTDIIIDYAISTTANSYQYHALVEKSKDMPTLPIPINDNGSKSYKKAFRALKEVDKEAIISSNANQQIIKRAISIVKNDTTAKSRSLKALLSFIIGDYINAKDYAQQAINYTSAKNTLPEFIYAVSLLYDENFDRNSSFEHFKSSIINEPDNKLIPLIFSIYLDRYILRFGADGKFLNSMFDFIDHYEIREFKAQNHTILLSRHFILLKQQQQKIIVLTDSLNNTIRENYKTLDVINQSLDIYKELIYNANLIFESYLSVKNKHSFWNKIKQSFSFQKNINFKKIQNKYQRLLISYENEEERLFKLISSFGDYQKNISQLKINFSKLERANSKITHLINSDGQLIVVKKLLDEYNNVINNSNDILDELFNLGFDNYSEIRIIELETKLTKYKQRSTELTKKIQDKERNTLIAYLVSILSFIIIIIYIFRGKILSAVRQFKQTILTP